MSSLLWCFVRQNLSKLVYIKVNACDYQENIYIILE